MKGKFVNTGEGVTLKPIDIGHSDYMGLVDADTAFWSLVKRDSLPEMIEGSALTRTYAKKRELFGKEMDKLRFHLKPTAVYFNITERCNLNCRYCYIPEKMRRAGKHMSKDAVVEALKILKAYFDKTAGKKALPKIIFHGAEPLLNKEALCNAIDVFSKDFTFGIQTNTVLLDRETVSFLKSHKVSIGISLDGPTADTVDKTRKSWSGDGVFQHVENAMKLLRDYDAWSVICTVTKENLRALPGLVNYLHKRDVPNCLLNVVRCTLPPSRAIKPNDDIAAKFFIDALEESYRLYRKTGRKLVVGNFANNFI